MPYPSKSSSTVRAALSARRTGSVPPWTIPNSAWSPGRSSSVRWRRLARAAHEAVRSNAIRSTSGPAGSVAQTSRTIWMSAPSRPWASTADSGVRRTADPSYTDAKVSPSSSTEGPREWTW